MEQKLFLVRKDIPEGFYDLELPFAEVVVVDPRAADIGLKKMEFQDVALFYGTKSHLDEQISNLLSQICPQRWMMILENSGLKAIRSAYEGGAVRVLFSDETEGELLPTLQRLQEMVLRKVVRDMPQQRRQVVLGLSDSVVARSNVDDVREIVRRLRNNLAQHGGIGAVLSMAELLSAASVEQEDGFLVPRELMTGFINSAAAANRTFDAMNYFINRLEKPPQSRATTITEIFNLWDSEVSLMAETAAEADRKLIFARETTYQERTILTDPEVLTLVFRELVVNALKFSRQGDTVVIMPVVREKQFGFFTLNNAYEVSGVLGVPESHQKKVFEALYKIAEHQDDAFAAYELTAGLGLGLTLAQRLIHAIGGEITVGNIISHSVDGSRRSCRVIAEALVNINKN